MQVSIGSAPPLARNGEAYPDAAILVTGVADPDSRAHGTDESLHLGEFATACRRRYSWTSSPPSERTVPSLIPLFSSQSLARSR